MRSEFASVVFFVLTLVAGAALEELLPKFFATGFPVLLAVALAGSHRPSTAEALVTAFAAGAVEDALCGFPPATSGPFFVIVALVARFLELPRATVVLAYPIYVVWLWLWRLDTGDGLALRLLVALPLGLVTTFAVEFALQRLLRKAGLE